MDGLKVKNEYTPGQKPALHTGKHVLQIFFLKQVIDTVADTDHGPRSPVELKVPHILQGIENIPARLDPALLGDGKHVLREIDTDHIISPVRQDLREFSCSAAKVYYYVFFIYRPGILYICTCRAGQTVFFQVFTDPVCPLLIGFLVHECIIHI